MQLSIAGTTDSVKVIGFFYGYDPNNIYNPLQQVTFDDGTVWNLATLVAKALTGTDGDDSIVGTNAGDNISGGLGNDNISGRDGNDTLSGVNPNNINPGIGERDSLSGGSGSDRFILGDNANIYYDDRNITTNGSNDYATITDFNPSEDKVKLQGIATNYRLETSGSNTNLYIDKAGSEPDELIAVFQNVTGLNLTSSAFEYITPVNAFAFSSAIYSVNETGTAQVTVIRTGSLVGQVSVTLISTNGTAQAPSDYNQTPISVIFNNGENSKTVTIPIVDDTTFELNETINLALSNPSNGFNLGGQNTATLTIIDNDTPVPGILAFSSATYSLNEDGTPVVAVTLTRTGGSDLEVSATIVLSNGTASAGEDYNNQDIVVTFADKQTSKTVTIPIINDTVYEPTETVNLTLSNPTGGATLGTQKTATLNIIDNDAVPGKIQFSNTTYSVNENGTVVNAVTLTRTNGSDGAVSATINLTNGTATAGSDYTNTPITVNFANGETSKTVNIPIVNDTQFELDETINLSLTNPQGGATLGTQTTATLTIINDDLPQPGTISLNSSSYTVNENGTASITLIRTGGSDGTVSVILTPTDGTAIAGSDYTNTPITVTFANAETSKTVTIPINNDTVFEPAETINLTLSNTTNGATLGIQTTAILTIAEEKEEVNITDISVGYYNQTLGNIFDSPGSSNSLPEPNLTLATNLGNWFADTENAIKNGFWSELQQIPQSWTTNQETAIIYEVDGGLYGVSNLKGNFGADNSIFVWVNGQYKFGASAEGGASANEYPNIDLGSLKTGKNYIQILRADHGGATNSYINIVGDYQQFPSIPGTLTFSGTNYTINEDGTPVVAVTLTRTGGSNGEVSVTLTPSGGTATAESDYNNSPITVTFANGETSKIVTIPINNNAVYEPTETVNLTLSNPTNGATLGNQTTAVVNIIDNDAVPGVLSFSNATYSFNENGTLTTTVTINRTGGSDGQISAAVLLSEGAASAGSDYITTPITVNFASGETSKNVTIPIINDGVFEPNETINLTLSNPTNGATVGSQNTAILTIIDDDFKPTLTVNFTNIQVTEGNTIQGTVTRNTDTTEPLIITLINSENSQVTVPNTVTIPAGATSTTFNITAVDDTLIELAKNYTLIASAAGFISGSNNLAIIDNDGVILSLNILPPSQGGLGGISENGGKAIATVTRNVVTDTPLLVQLYSSDTTEATVPDTVIIAANQASATFEVQGIDDVILDGTQAIVITAKPTYTGTNITLDAGNATANLNVVVDTPRSKDTGILKISQS